MMSSATGLRPVVECVRQRLHSPSGAAPTHPEVRAGSKHRPVPLAGGFGAVGLVRPCPLDPFFVQCNNRIMEVTFAQSARRHKVGRARARHVVDNPYTVVRQPAPEGSQLSDDRLVLLGDDHTGRALEVVAVEVEGGLHVIHVMDLRAKWREHYEEGQP